MNTLRTLVHLMKADIQERTRGYSFLVTVAATLYLCYLISDGTIAVYLGKCQPVPNSAWTGMAMALCSITFVGLVGFYVVKNAVERDRETGVGQILAATPMSKLLYILGKVLSNFAVLAIVLGIIAIVATLMQVFKQGGGQLDFPVLISPFVLLALPCLFFIAALSVLFESVGLLRGGFGNILYFFLFSALVVVPMETGLLSTDVMGLRMAMDNIQADVRRHVPDYDGAFSIGTGGKEYSDSKPIEWVGMPWTQERIVYRALLVLYGLALSVLAAALFDRFSSSATGATHKRRGLTLMRRVAMSPLQKIPALILLPIDALLRRYLLGRMLVAELRLTLQGLPLWWYLVALSLWIASVAMEPTQGRSYLLGFIWIWPVLLWSGMGTREKRFRTGQVLFSAPRPLARQLPAIWGAGIVVALLVASGLLLRLALDGDTRGLFATLSGAIFIPSLALALGVWSGTSKTFEALYVAFWYVGPMHHTPSIDFMGTTDGAVSSGTPLVFLTLGALLFLLAIAGRRWQLAAA